MEIWKMLLSQIHVVHCCTSPNFLVWCFFGLVYVIVTYRSCKLWFFCSVSSQPLASIAACCHDTVLVLSIPLHDCAWKLLRIGPYLPVRNRVPWNSKDKITLLINLHTPSPREIFHELNTGEKDSLNSTTGRKQLMFPTSISHWILIGMPKFSCRK